MLCNRNFYHTSWSRQQRASFCNCRAKHFEKLAENKICYSDNKLNDSQSFHCELQLQLQQLQILGLPLMIRIRRMLTFIFETLARCSSSRRRQWRYKRLAGHVGARRRGGGVQGRVCVAVLRRFQWKQDSFADVIVRCSSRRIIIIIIIIMLLSLFIIRCIDLFRYILQLATDNMTWHLYASRLCHSHHLEKSISVGRVWYDLDELWLTDAKWNADGGN